MKVKCEECFDKEDKEMAIIDGWRHYVDVEINGKILKQDIWLCPECIPQVERIGQ